MRWLAAVIAVTIGVVLLFCWSVDAARAVLIGWAEYMYRVVPQINVDGKTVLAGLIGFGLCVLGVHWFGRWALRSSPWKFGWSIAGVGTLIVAFAAGICMIGVTHQTGWLLTNKEPVFVETRVSSKDSAYRLRALPSEVYNPVYGGPFFGRQSWFTVTFLGFESPINYYSWDDPYCRHFYSAVRLTNPELSDAPVRNSDGYGLAHYAANCRAMANGAIRPFKEFTDGTANTLLVGEVNANFKPWGDPLNVRDPARGINRSPYGFGGPPSRRGALFAMADGSVRFFSERTSPEVLRALATPDGGEEIDLSLFEKR
jgi:hypothetical protein